MWEEKQDKILSFVKCALLAIDRRILVGLNKRTNKNYINNEKRCLLKAVVNSKNNIFKKRKPDL